MNEMTKCGDLGFSRDTSQRQAANAPSQPTQSNAQPDQNPRQQLAPQAVLQSAGNRNSQPTVTQLQVQVDDAGRTPLPSQSQQQPDVGQVPPLAAPQTEAAQNRSAQQQQSERGQVLQPQLEVPQNRNVQVQQPVVSPQQAPPPAQVPPPVAPQTEAQLNRNAQVQQPGISPPGQQKVAAVNDGAATNGNVRIETTAGNQGQTGPSTGAPPPGKAAGSQWVMCDQRLVLFQYASMPMADTKPSGPTMISASA